MVLKKVVVVVVIVVVVMIVIENVIVIAIMTRIKDGGQTFVGNRRIEIWSIWAVPMLTKYQY